MTDQYAVIGNPITHSKSPFIHTEFAKQTGQDIRYESVLAPLDGFTITVQELIKQGFKGANVTVPFKFEAFNLARHHTARAICAGAANTLTLTDDGIFADNTDGAGLVCDIALNLGMEIKNKRVLLIGAGGAAEGVLAPLLAESPAQLVIANRTFDKAQKMVVKAASHLVIASSFEGLCDDSISHLPFDIAINATSSGLADSTLAIPDSVFAKGSLAYDMMYGRETPFMAQARAAGAQVADGLGMLVEQAAEAFQIWRGVRPQTAPVIKMMRAI